MKASTWRTDTANQRGGSEWEPIKILLEGDGNSNKMNTASNTRLGLTTQVGQAHVATGVPLDLGTNTQPSDPRTQRNTKPRVHWPTPVRPVSTTGQTSPCWWELTTSTKWLHTDQAVQHTGQTGPSLKAPKSPNRPTDLQTDPNSKQLQHRTTANTPRRLPEQKPTKGCTGQTSQEHRSDRCILGSSGWTAPAGQLPQIQTSISRIAPRTWTRLWGY
jgi:hypothetical protein